MDVVEINGKPFTLWLTDEADESVVYSGIARLKASGLFLERDQQPPFEIRSEWYERIRTVTSEEVRKILRGADYFLHLLVGNLPDESGSEGFEKTGLKWPD
jgi:hypothetical protein